VDDDDWMSFDEDSFSYSLPIRVSAAELVAEAWHSPWVARVQKARDQRFDVLQRLRVVE
jgi:hypothetical protein